MTRTTNDELEKFRQKHRRNSSLTNHMNAGKASTMLRVIYFFRIIYHAHKDNIREKLDLSLSRVCCTAQVSCSTEFNERAWYENGIMSTSQIRSVLILINYFEKKNTDN